MEQRMAKLALAEISQQKLRDADAAGRRQQSCKKVESEEKVRLRAEGGGGEEEEEAQQGDLGCDGRDFGQAKRRGRKIESRGRGEGKVQ